jgi:hypothetical protein
MIYFSFAACCRCVVEIFFWPKLFSVARFPLIFSVVDDAFTRKSFLLCGASVSWINEFKQKERKKEENRSKIVNDKSRILVRTQITSSKMRLYTSKCLGIEFFSEKESTVSIESRNINLLAAPYVLITTDCPLKVLRSASVHLEVSWRQVFL